MVKNKTGYLIELLSHPGESLQELLCANNMTQKELAARIGVTEKHITQIITGKASITPGTALKLSNVFSLSASFWNNLQKNYDEALNKIKTYDLICSDEMNDKAQKTYRELVKIGEIQSQPNIKDKILQLRDYLGLANLNVIPNVIQSDCAFRQSQKVSQNEYSMLAWIKYCERATDEIEVKEFSKEKLMHSLSEIKALNLVNLNEAIPKLKDIFAECGIAFRVLKNITGAPVNGFIKKINDKMRLCVTIRGAYADIFWFSLFHEIEHLLMLKDGEWMLDYKQEDMNVEIEKKVDELASGILINEDSYKAFIAYGKRDIKSITEFARSNNVHVGIVVGRLQHDGIIPLSYFNESREKYTWAK